MRDVVKVGSVTWHWSSNLVCAGPEERLIVIRGGGGPGKEDAHDALCRADRMEWRDAGFRKWRIHRRGQAITFSSYKECTGPVTVFPDEPLAGMTDRRLEELLAAARDES